MKKDIRIVITGTLISVFLFALGMFITTNSSFKIFLQESTMDVKIIPALLAYLCVLIGFLGIISFMTVTIMLISFEYYNKKVNCKRIKKIKSELPKKTEFSVNIINQNNEDLKKILYENLKCTALFNGSTVHIEFSLPEKVSLETDDVLWFKDNFNY